MRFFKSNQIQSKLGATCCLDNAASLISRQVHVEPSRDFYRTDKLLAFNIHPYGGGKVPRATGQHGEVPDVVRGSNQIELNRKESFRYFEDEDDGAEDIYRTTEKVVEEVISSVRQEVRFVKVMHRIKRRAGRQPHGHEQVRPKPGAIEAANEGRNGQHENQGLDHITRRRHGFAREKVRAGGCRATSDEQGHATLVHAQQFVEEPF